jgi:hypothetical protein
MLTTAGWVLTRAGRVLTRAGSVLTRAGWVLTRAGWVLTRAGRVAMWAVCVPNARHREPLISARTDEESVDECVGVNADDLETPTHRMRAAQGLEAVDLGSGGRGAGEERYARQDRPNQQGRQQVVARGASLSKHFGSFRFARTAPRRAEVAAMRFRGVADQVVDTSPAHLYPGQTDWTRVVSGTRPSGSYVHAQTRRMHV